MTRVTRSAIACVALAACGYSKPGTPHAEPDAGGVEVSAPTDAPTGGVTIQVTVDGLPVEHAPVYFQAADSTLALVTETDANGRAGAALDAGGFVTALLRATSDGHDDDAIDRLSTFAGVQPGDVLHLDVRPLAPATGVQYATALTALALGAANYQVFTPCDDDAPSLLDAFGAGTVTLIGCGDHTDLVVRPIDADGAPLGQASYLRDVALPPGSGPGGSDAFPIGTLVLGPTFVALEPSSMTASGLPAATGFVAATQVLLTADGRALFGSEASAMASNGAATMAFDEPPPSTGPIMRTTMLLGPLGSDAGEHQISTWGPSAAAFTGALLLPDFATGPVLAGSTISWTEAPDPTRATPDLVRATAHGVRDDVPLGHVWSWRVIAPRGGGPSVALPVLPFDGRFDYNAAAGDVLTVDELTAASLPGGYDGVRANGFGELGVVADPSVAGTIAIETLSSPSL